MPAQLASARIAELEDDAVAAIRRIDALEHAFKGLLSVLPDHSVEAARNHAYDSLEALLAACNPGLSVIRNETWFPLCALFGEQARD